jgi:predicted phosphodiesterase
VRGNRDIYTLHHLPAHLTLEFASVRIGLIHGHGRLFDYLLDKADWVRYGIREERYRQRVMRAFPGVRLVIFGHLHRRINTWIGDRFLFNPGSACCPDWVGGGPPSAALITLDAGEIKAVEFLDLS